MRPSTAYRHCAESRTSRSANSISMSIRSSSSGLAITKMAAAMANYELGLLTKEQHDAIVQACKEIIDGKHHEQFPVDMIQGGAGTTTNMNANEVIANRALELMGHKRGEYQYCSPNDHVNCAQSTNDAYPTAIHIGHGTATCVS